ncbi:hypothetical protein JXA48_02885 [Candidatus Woesearchaeota archaeon]|nr:hypothetical protein [Candidatus Woesearchaeota archaeon]
METKNNSKQFFLIVNGPSCGGKSSLIKILKSQLENIFSASRDKVKWLISDYAYKDHKEIVDEMMFEMISVALKRGLSVIKDGLLEPADNYVELAKSFDVPIYFVNVFRFDELTQIYETYKVSSSLEFDTSVNSSEYIADVVIDYINS